MRQASGPRVGRRPSTTQDHITDVALALFATHGFDEVSVDDVAKAAGIARRTLFRYYASKNAIPWGDFDAQEIFEKLNGDLKIKPVKVGFAAYYESCGRVDLMEKHPNEKPVFISGKDVRATLLKGDMVDPRIMRPSTSRILASAMKQ